MIAFKMGSCVTCGTMLAPDRSACDDCALLEALFIEWLKARANLEDQVGQDYRLRLRSFLRGNMDSLNAPF